MVAAARFVSVDGWFSQITVSFVSMPDISSFTALIRPHVASSKCSAEGRVRFTATLMPLSESETRMPMSVSSGSAALQKDLKEKLVCPASRSAAHARSTSSA